MKSINSLHLIIQCFVVSVFSVVFWPLSLGLSQQHLSRRRTLKRLSRTLGVRSNLG